jgi:hypothetical protein
MSQTENGADPQATLEEIQRSWPAITQRVTQLETERVALEAENKSLRALVEQVIEHRQKSHSDLVNVLTMLVSKLPMNDLGVVVARLVEHNNHVTEISARMAKGKVEDNMLQPAILKALDKTKRDLLAELRIAVEELLALGAPFEEGVLQGLVANPESFFSPSMVRANRGFVKGQLPRERIVKEFGEDALVFFKDLTTDVKFNPRPKVDEVMLAFKSDFEELFAQNPNAAAAKRGELQALYQKVRAGRDNSESSRAQKNAFLRLSFILELLHYYDNQNTESPDVVFAQRLPPLIEQLGVPVEVPVLDEKAVKQAENMLAFIVSANHRSAVVNNVGKGGGILRMLRYTLTFRLEKLADNDPLVVECVKHLIPQGKAPGPESLAAVMRLFSPHMQEMVIRAIMDSDRMRKEESNVLGRAVAKLLCLDDFEQLLNRRSAGGGEADAQSAWDIVKNLIGSRATPNEIAEAVRKRLHEKYDAAEVKQSWMVLTESDPMIFVRVFSLLPYLPDGHTDPIAQAVLEAYATRLTHEKYATVYNKVIHALKNLFKVKADSPALVNFVALVKWVDPASAEKIARDIGMAA